MVTINYYRSLLRYIFSLFCDWNLEAEKLFYVGNLDVYYIIIFATKGKNTNNNLFHVISNSYFNTTMSFGWASILKKHDTAPKINRALLWTSGMITVWFQYGWGNIEVWMSYDYGLIIVVWLWYDYGYSRAFDQCIVH